jgi:hypothetical protein
MHGPHIEQQFQHFAFEHEQLQRKMATRRLFETEQLHQERPRRSLVDLFGRYGHVQLTGSGIPESQMTTIERRPMLACRWRVAG